jgi:hypothetical protein
VALGGSLAAGAAALLSWMVFVVDRVRWSLDDTRPDYYGFSPYMKYRDGLGDTLEGVVAAGTGYALLAGGLTLGAAVALRRRSPVPAWLLGLAAAGATALPAVVPSILPRSEYGMDPVFKSDELGPYLGLTPPGAAAPVPTACFEHGVEPFDPSDPGRPKLCLKLIRTPESLRLVEAPWHGGLLSALEDELNSTGATPTEDVGRLEVAGLEVYEAEWHPPPGG